jgi:putative tryptophan/tyrosine transport system substrate-binding protein
MKRREFLSFLVTAWPLAARAQQDLVHRVGNLALGGPGDTPPPVPANWDSFVQGLREMGFAEGRNIIFEHRSAHHQPALFPRAAKELADIPVDVIFARGSWALAAAKNATNTIPIVRIDLEIDPIESGLVESIARPGANITGLFLDLSELSGKHLQVLKEIIPGISRVGVLGDPAVNAPQLRELEKVGQSLAVQAKPLGVTSENLEGAVEAARSWRADALIVLSSPLTLAYRARIGDLAAKAGLPTMSLFRAHVHAGGLISYGPDLPDMFRRCGVYVGRVLSGSKPADLPIERPVRFELAVNLKTAKVLGITIPEAVLVRADEVIE